MNNQQQIDQINTGEWGLLLQAVHELANEHRYVLGMFSRLFQDINL
ncbi:hypothetical protein [Candidatus Parabeggiatoa sp. HSG14]|nr:hypothetical protein [Thiotrichales bacterium HSG14]